MKEDIEASHLIITTTVQGIEYARSDPGGIVTKVSLSNTNVIKGDLKDAPQTIFIEGGELEGERVTVLGAPKFTVGEKYLLFLRFDNLVCPVVGMRLRTFLIKADPLTGQEYILDYNGRNIYGLEDGKLILPPPADAKSEGDLRALGGKSKLKPKNFGEMINITSQE